MTIVDFVNDHSHCLATGTVKPEAKEVALKGEAQCTTSLFSLKLTTCNSWKNI